MSALDLLNKRLNFRGGSQEGRFQRDKLTSLKRALWYSYQGEVAVLKDGREFRCLINNDKLNTDYDDKIFSIPYKDVCLSSGIEEETLVKSGDVFLWKETNTHWIIVLEYLEEDSYFRGDIKRCEDVTFNIDDKSYYVYIRGPVETTIQWNQKSTYTWNDLNYTLIMYITKDEYTENYFSRFKKVKYDDKTWEVAAVDTYCGDGIVEVVLQEYYTNDLEEKYEEQQEQEKETPPVEVLPEDPQISGSYIVRPYDIHTYTLLNVGQTGMWSINNNKAKIIKHIDSSSIEVEITTGTSGEFILSYITEDGAIISLPVEIESL